MATSERDKFARRVVKELISVHTRFRGECLADGLVTLLTVNYNAGLQVDRLTRSFRRFCPGGRVVVVDNGSRESIARAVADIYVRPPGNLHHSLGLDYGMRKVNSEWTLVCDPDSAIIGVEFLPRMLELAAGYGVSGIDSAHNIYHPICVLFRTEMWKSGGFSFRERWPYWDVAGELTAIVGGRHEDTLLRRTRTAGPRFQLPIYIVEVYEDVFTNTYLGSRVGSDESDESLGLPRKVVVPVHKRWEAWVDKLIDGQVDPFPFIEVRP